MNQDKRVSLMAAVEIIDVVLYMLDEGVDGFEERTHQSLSRVINHVRTDEYHKLQNMRKHEGKNASTDKQIELSVHCLMLLDEALQAHEDTDYPKLRSLLERAQVTEVPPKRAKDSVARKKTSTKGLRKRAG
ncbi:hypothetical protein SEA_REDFIELD_60 [Microbacterium phage Redfield]|uniref:Uncharacterized protein n=4 Tax=Ilzatvirus hamlet TaxID=2560591 RepID=A0A345MEM9_9CAUD|nr:hypothetical protein PBI_PEPPINO_60 [Microbacterium phage Peppino]AUX83585.1 hypothetical protein PBI_BALSA_59 [Microbacterium phage Balsa]AXH46450.1 hypothetical protein SEA_REDFIELD_60 [Microbacterium phage Redfield]AXH69010.1 hypothetical protein SCHNAPSIDEE_60 [Microbacterium phage Schnapsidee]